MMEAPRSLEDEALSGVVWWGRAILLVILVWFTWLGVIHLDRTIGLWAHYAGTLVMSAAIGFGAWTTLKKRSA